MKLKLIIILGGLAAGIVLVRGPVVCGNTVKIFYSDGVIQQGDGYDRVEVYDTPPSHTTVNMTGGYVGRLPVVDTGLYTYDASIVNISGGIVEYLHTNNSSTVNISGGVVGSLWTPFGETTISSQDESTINVYEGGLLFGGSFAFFYMFDLSTLNVYGGGIDSFLISFNPSVVNIYDGSLSMVELGGPVNIYGGRIGGAFPSSFYSTVNIYGYDFVYEPHWYKTPPDDIIRGEQWVSRLTGMGLYGVPISIIDLPDPAINPNIHLIPEPGTMLLLALGGLLCAGTDGTEKIRKMTRR
jgi:hypothetical protein